MIDVIIPAYNAHEFIGLTLSSIAFQDCVDMLNVYIIDDCSEKNYSEFVKFYSKFMNIKEINLDKNSGPGCARQVGIDSSKAEYLIFIDSDDVFSDNFAIRRLYNAIVGSDADISISGFHEEKDDDFMYRDISYVWMHGKMYRRKFLIDNAIKFNDSRANEDCGFNYLCFLCDASYVEVTGSSYIWRNNINSITRVNNGETFKKNIKSFTYNMMWAFSESLKRHFNEMRFSNVVYGTLLSFYYHYLQGEDSFEEGDVFEQISPLVDYLNDYPLSPDTRATITKNQLMSFTSGSDLIKIFNPRITLNEFVDMLDSKRSGV